MKSVDVAVIGAGIAGASVAAELAEETGVLLLERESQPGYHSTGRSAAMYETCYGPPPIRALTRASGSLYFDPPEVFGEAALLAPRGAVFFAPEDQLEALEALKAELGPDAGVEALSASEAEAMMPLLRKGYAAAALYDPHGMDIDVGAVLQGYLKLLARRGGDVLTRAEVTKLTRHDDHWEITTTAGTVRAAQVVNAAGAWADAIGVLAGAERIGLVPKRRTALTIDVPEVPDISRAPLIVDALETFYAKPDAGRLLLSPANADPDVPSDVQPDEMDIAWCVDRAEKALNISVRRIASKWAGLRSFVADGVPVAGWSSEAEGFYWLAGQGGYGIQTAPALSRWAAAEVLGREAPADIAAEGLTRTDLAPARASLKP